LFSHEENKIMEDSLSQYPRHLVQKRGDYGFDAPYVPIMFAIIGSCCLIAAILVLWLVNIPLLAIILLLYAVLMFLSTGSYLYTTRIGKFRAWADILNGLGLKGNEQVLDMGCGRGAVLLMAAKLLPSGKASGVDLWKSRDQAGNDRAVTQHNAELEGVARRVELHTADMRKLPFTDNSFDLVLSSLAIHNISDAGGRQDAIDEAMRVLKPGGRLAIADIRSTQQYEQRLRELGASDVSLRSLGWRFWYGGPWVATKLVSATKPG
jgi:SAM-dependent methyltransferase